MSDEKDGNGGAWARVPTWRGFKREMDWWCSALDLASTTKYNLAARWLLRQSGVNVAGKLSADKMLVGALDSACNRTCTGTEWLNNYLRCLRDAPEEVRGLVKSHKEYETFKFGNGGTQVSVARWRLPMQLDGSIICFWTSLVPVPSLGLLLGRDFLEAIGADMHFAHRTLRCEHLTGKPIALKQLAAGNLLGGESANMEVKVGRWKRMYLRMGERFRWAAKGLLLWLLQRPYLRYLPLPYPSTTTTAAWLAQVRKQVSDGTIPPRYLKNCLEKNLFTMSNLAECRHLRNRVGLRTSFIEDPVLAGMMAAQTKGIAAKLRSAAQKEAKELAKKAEADGSREQEARALIGPRGGLPTLRADLVKLAALFHVDLGEKDSVAQIEEKVKPMIEILKNKKPAVSPAKANTAEEISASSSSPPARLFHDNPKKLAVQQQEMRAMMEQMSRELALLRSQVTPEMEVDLSSEPSLIPDSPQDASPVNFTEAEIRELNGQAYEELHGANLTAQFGDDIPAEVTQEIRLGLRDGALQNESQPKNVLISKNVKPPDKERSLVSEVYTTSQNVMREAERRGHKVGPAMSLDNGWNFLLAEHRSRALKVLEEEKPYCVVLAFPCGPFSPLQYFNTRGLTSLDQRQADGLVLMEFAIEVAKLQMKGVTMRAFTQSRWHVLPDKSSKSVIQFLTSRWLAMFGAPRVLVADQGREFAAQHDLTLRGLPAAPPVALPEEPEETAMPMTPALQPPVHQRGVPGADLPPVKPEELVQVAQQAAPIPSMVGSSALPSRRISDVTGMGPAPGSPVPELIRRAGTAGGLLARQIAQARDLAEESGGMKRPAEVDMEALAEQSAFDGARSSPSAPSGVNESLVMAFEKGEDELMKQLQHGKEHPLRVIASLADIDKQQPLDAKVKDHGSWGGRWDLPSRSEWQLHQKLGWSWPTGSHDLEALLASAAHKELFWKNMSPEEKIAFREDKSTLEGVIISHVDDLLLGGGHRAQALLQDLGQILGFGSVEYDDFTYCGKHIRQHDDGSISISMIEYHSNLQPVSIAVHRRAQTSAELNNSERRMQDEILEAVPFVQITDAKDLFDKGNSDTATYGAQKSLGFTIGWIRATLARACTLKWTSTSNMFVDCGTKDMDESYLHRILASGRWCYTFNKAYVKQGKPSRKQLALSSSSAALDGEPLNEALPVFAFLQQLAESPGWHHKGEVVTHVAHHAGSYRSPIGRYEIEKYPIRTTYARFDLDTGISHWRILEDHVKMRSLTNRQALLSTPARVLISIFTGYSCQQEDRAAVKVSN
ncbi:unnamed protein product [Durusdinium trenchii]|uniref:Integrase catalytic domain-containing protein n=1 Tax=Durusdinium trenchii TaxID=1381693 RepID=A0ABP0HK05_9DINO